MRIDKEEDERRTKIMANSARHLQLSEEAAARAQSQHELSMDRQKFELEKGKKAAEEAERAKALFNVSREEWIKANPEALEDPMWSIMFDLVKDNPDHFKNMALEYARDKNKPGLNEAQIMAKDLGPGQRLSIQLSDGSTFSALGPSTEKAGGIPQYKLQSTIFDGQQSYEQAIKDKEIEIAKYKDETKKILNVDDGTTQGTAEAAVRLKRQQEMEADLKDLINNPNREWDYWQRELSRLGLNQDGMDNMRDVFKQTKEAEARAREKALASARELSPSEAEIVARARGEREAAGLPVAEEPTTITPREIVPREGLTPFGERVVGGLEGADQATKEFVDNLRKKTGLRLPWDPPEGTY